MKNVLRSDLDNSMSVVKSAENKKDLNNYEIIGGEGGKPQDFC